MNVSFSIVIPAYNSASFIAKTIDRALDQEYPAHQIIVIDDGSTDETSKVLERYGKKITFRRIANSGPAAARNLGNSLVTSSHVVFLDNDDIFFRNRLKKQYEFILRYPKIGLFCCNYTVRYKHHGFRLEKQFSTLMTRRELNFDSPLIRDPFELLIRENIIGTPSSVVIRRDLIDRVGPWNENKLYSYDYEYWLRCALVADFLLMSEVLVHKINRKESMSENVAEMNLCVKNTLREMCQSVYTGDLLRRRRIMRECGRSLARCSYEIGNAKFEKRSVVEAFKYYLTALKEDPTFQNLRRFAWTATKKIARFLTFDLLNRSRFSRQDLTHA